MQKHTACSHHNGHITKENVGKPRQREQSYLVKKLGKAEGGRNGSE